MAAKASTITIDRKLKNKNHRDSCVKVRRILRAEVIGSPKNGAGLNTEAAEKDEP